jgi:hypothetical protein
MRRIKSMMAAAYGIVGREVLGETVAPVDLFEHALDDVLCEAAP